MISLSLSSVSVVMSGRSWTPADLFTGGAVGVILDPSAAGALSQDSAGTIGVTAAGQPVGLARDQTTGARHLRQTDNTARPLYQVDGAGRPHLVFDGVNDRLITNAFDMASDAMTAIVATRLPLGGTQYGLMRMTAGTGSFGMVKTSTNRASAIAGGSSPVQLTSSVVVDTANEVYSFRARIGTPVMNMRRNGVEVGQSSATMGTGTFGSGALEVGSWSGGQWFPGNVYGVILVNRLLGDAELLQAEQWLAVKAGVTFA
jgi:hypothetical protein